MFWQPSPQKSMVVPQFPNSLQQTFKGHVSLPAAALRPHSVVVIEALTVRGEICGLLMLVQSRSNARAGLQSSRRRPRDLSELNILCRKRLWTCDIDIGYLERRCEYMGKQRKDQKGPVFIPTRSRSLAVVKVGKSSLTIEDTTMTAGSGVISILCCLLYHVKPPSESLNSSQTTIRGNGWAC